MVKTFLKLVYKRIPFKHQLFRALKHIWTPPESVFRHLHFTGVLNLEIDKCSFKMQHYGYTIENEAFWLGLDEGWEKVSMGLWSKLSQDSDVIFDVGANTGIYSLVSQAVNPKASVYAFEPVERVYNKLEHNFRLNKYPIVGIEKAASNYNGGATIYDEADSEHILSVAVNKNLLPEEANVLPTEIKTVRLESFIEENELNKIDLMKIDVETHEPEVLEGMGKYLVKHKPTMLIEILNNDVGEAVESLVNGLDYLYFNIDEGNSSIRKVDTITKSDYFNYLICEPAVARNLELR